MQSDYNHIDDFFRRKEEEAKPELSMQDSHWQQMKQTMGGTQPVGGVKSIQWKLMVQLMAGLAAVIMIIVIVKHLGNSQSSDAGPVLATGRQPAKTETPKATLPSNNPDQSGNKKQIPVIKGIREDDKIQISTQQKWEVPMMVLTYPTFDSTANHDNPTDQIQLLNAFFSSLQTPAQEFVINCDRDTIIHGRQGTSVYIPAGSFKSVKGKTLRGQLTIKLKEFYEIADMVGHKLATASNEEMLATGGMLHIEALQDNEKLVLKAQSSLKVEMPTERFDPDMQLFYGAEENPGPHSEQPANVQVQETINWNPAGQKQFYFNFNNWQITVTDWANDPRDVVTRRGRKIAKFILSDANSRDDLETARAELKIRHGMKYDEIKLRMGWKRERTSRTPLSNSLPTIDGMVGDQVRLNLKDARQLGLISAADSAWHAERWKKQVEKSDSLQRQYLQLRDQYTFNITTLGWINCDKFLARLGPRTRFIASTGEQFADTYFQSYLIFKDLNSIISGTWRDGKLVFDMMPVGKRATLVCVGIKGGKAYSSLKEINISPSMLKGLEFEETTPVKFRESLKRFGNVIRG